MGITAKVTLSSSIRIELEGAKPEALFVHLAHATRSGYDVRQRLAPTAAGTYAAELPPMPPGRWRIAIEDPRGTWRILKEAS
jgi:hypothetical protein